jgi:hypothetical protein
LWRGINDGDQKRIVVLRVSSIDGARRLSFGMSDSDLGRLAVCFAGAPAPGNRKYVSQFTKLA